MENFGNTYRQFSDQLRNVDPLILEGAKQYIPFIAPVIGAVGAIDKTVRVGLKGAELGRNFGKRMKHAIWAAKGLSPSFRSKFGEVPQHLRTDLLDNYMNASAGFNSGITNHRKKRKYRNEPRNSIKAGHAFYFGTLRPRHNTTQIKKRTTTQPTNNSRVVR